MERKLVCPICRDKGDVDSNLRCGVCKNQLEYASEDGTLRVVRDVWVCPQCGHENPPNVCRCEACHSDEIAFVCPYCGNCHYFEDEVCPKTGEIIYHPKETKKKKNTYQHILLLSSFLAIIILGFLMFRKSNPPVNPPSSPAPTKSRAHTFVMGNGPRIDVVFVVDATGSMQDEIDVVKQKIRQMVQSISEGQPKPRVRYGIVAYRDKGDEFVTKKYPLTYSINKITSNINELEANGGGDTPESVNEALKVAIMDMNWDESTNTKKIVFLIGDAGPHMDYQEAYKYKDISLIAKEKGIKINTIGCSGITISGEPEFREIAKLTGGKFDYLTYQQTISTSEGTPIHIVKAGDKTYVVEKGAEKEWKNGYKALLKRKKAREVRLSDILPKGGLGACMSPPSAPMKNNLDKMLVEEVKKEAEEMGVKYSK